MRKTDLEERAQLRSDDEREAQPTPLPVFPARPQQLPRLTYWPLVVAASLAIMGWGLITTWIFAVAGGLGMVVGLGGWIGEMLYENNTNLKEERNDAA